MYQSIYSQPVTASRFLCDIFQSYDDLLLYINPTLIKGGVTAPLLHWLVGLVPKQFSSQLTVKGSRGETHYTGARWEDDECRVPFQTFVP